MHAAGRHDNAGSPRTALTNASCVAHAISPSVEDKDAKLARITAPVLELNLTSAAAKYVRVAGPSSRCAVAANAAARTLGDGSFSAHRTTVGVGDLASSCATLVGRSLGQCAWRLRGLARANAETQSAALARTFDAPNRSPISPPRPPSLSLASLSDDPYPRLLSAERKCGGT